LAGDVEKKQYGRIYEHFKEKGEEQKGIEACIAIHDLLEVKSIEVLLNTFIIPLIEQTDVSGRIHTSININTETGRLSARNPNLLNQPALEKDRYKIRKSFVAKPGHKLIVADYG
jgi:DNA polymerase-1